MIKPDIFPQKLKINQPRQDKFRSIKYIGYILAICALVEPVQEVIVRWEKSYDG